MTDADRLVEDIAKAMFLDRIAAMGKGIMAGVWEEQNDAVRDTYRRLAGVAIAHLRGPGVRQ